MRKIGLRAAAPAFAFLFASGAARGAQWHLPAHVPPRLRPEAGEAKRFLLGLGWSRAESKDISVDGPGGGWELAGPLGKTLGGHLQAGGFAFKGSIEPLAAGRRDGAGFSGTVEADLSWPLSREGARGYAGLMTAFTAMDIASPLSVTYSGGRVQVEPDTALSLVLGVPLGVSLGRAFGQHWRGELAAHAVGYLGGATFFTYTLAGPLGLGSSSKIDPHAALGARLRLERPAWRLGLEAGGALSTSSGNNESLATLYGALTARLF